MTRSTSLGRLARLGAAFIAATLTSGCAYNSDMFDFVTWDGAEETEPVALSGSQLDQLRAQRDAQLQAMEDPAFRSVELDLPNIDDYAAGQVEAMQRGVFALISDSAALSAFQGDAPTDVDSELDALIAAETNRRRAARGVATISPAPPERETFVIGQARPAPPPVPPEALRTQDPTLQEPTPQERAESAERSSQIRQALVEREAQSAVRRELYREELAQQLQSEPAAGAGEPTVLPAAAAPALASLAPLSARAGAETPVSAAARAPDTAAAAPAPAISGGAPANNAGSALGGAPSIATSPDAPPSAVPNNLSAATTAAAAPTPAPTPPPSAAETAAPTATPAPPPKGTPHTVASDDTLASIAKKYGSTPAAIRSANGMDPRRSIYVGQELIVPQGVARISGALPPSAADPLPKPIAAPRNLASPKLSQYRSDRAPQVTPPIKGGEVVTAYGAPLGSGGKLSTGIEIAAGPAAPVIAASDGKVAYLSPPRGSRGGELTLIHADGMITRYKGLGPISLRHGARVRRGQQIATLPNTGDAKMLFELLDGQDPVDPVPFFVAQVR